MEINGKLEAIDHINVKASGIQRKKGLKWCNHRQLPGGQQDWNFARHNWTLHCFSLKCYEEINNYSRKHLMSFQNHQTCDYSFHGAWFVWIKDEAVTQGTLCFWEATSVFLIRHSWSCSIVRNVFNRDWTRKVPKVNLRPADAEVFVSWQYEMQVCMLDKQMYYCNLQ